MARYQRKRLAKWRQARLPVPAHRLPLPSGRVSLLGRVLYTNVPGNLKRDHLPTGMGIAFVRTPPDQAAALESEVDGMAARFYV